MDKQILNKCGEIYTFHEEKEHKFLIKCNYCDKELSNLEDFAEHYVEQHLEGILGIPDDESLPMEEDSFDTFGKVVNHNISDKISLQYEKENNIIAKGKVVLPDFSCGVVTKKLKKDHEEFVPTDIVENVPSTAAKIVAEPVQEFIVKSEVDLGNLVDSDTADASEYDFSLEYLNEEDDDESEPGQRFLRNSEFTSDDEGNVKRSLQTKDFREWADSNPELALFLIDAFHNEPILWDINFPQFYNTELKNKAFENIEQLVKLKTPYQISLEEIKDVCKYFKSFSTRVYKQNIPWFANKLDFLQLARISYQNKRREVSCFISGEAPSLPVPDLTSEENIRFIELYKRYPALWNPNEPAFHIDTANHNAFQHMREIFQKVFPQLAAEQKLETLINQIRLAASMEKYKKIKAEQNEKPYEPSSEISEHLEFLDDYLNPYKCPTCSRIIHGYYSYRIHKSQHDGSKPFTCSLCGKHYDRRDAFRKHLRRYAEGELFKCEICGKTFPTLCRLQDHNQKHLLEKPHGCEVCGARFRTELLLTYHQKRHSDEAPFKCAICDKRFYKKYPLKVHMRTHLGIRDYVCDICGKGFAQRIYLRRHREIHDETKAYKCEICGKRFAQNSGLNTHLKTHKKKPE